MSNGLEAVTHPPLAKFAAQCRLCGRICLFRDAEKALMLGINECEEASAKLIIPNLRP